MISCEKYFCFCLYLISLTQQSPIIILSLTEVISENFYVLFSFQKKYLMKKFSVLLGLQNFYLFQYHQEMFIILNSGHPVPTLLGEGHNKKIFSVLNTLGCTQGN